MSVVLDVTESEFDERALQAKGVVVIDFSATWCGPCKRLYPELMAAASDLEGQATFLKVDVDESPEVAIRFGVQSVPNITILKDGAVVDTIIGVTPKANIVARVQRQLPGA